MINKGIASLVVAMGLSSAAAFAACGDNACKPAASACGSSCDRGYQQGVTSLDDTVASGYSKAGRIDPKGGCDWFVTADFLYWEAKQDGMDLTVNVAGHDAGGQEVDTAQFQKFHYRPAFKVGLGYSSNYDDWVVGGEYTWYHHEFRTDINGPSATASAVNYAIPQYENSSSYRITSLSSKWKLAVDIADLTVARPAYIGKSVVLSPVLGLRAAWLKQDLTGNTANFSGSSSPFTSFARTQSHRVHSWGVGPRAGIEGNWLVGCGFRLIGNGYASLLYTKYNRAQIDFTTTAASAANSSVSQKYTKNYSTVKAMTELDIGFGWGDYYGADEDYYFDLAVTYDFNVFWNQNMMRDMNNQFNAYSSDAAGNLYLHGLTVAARLDF